MPTPGDPTNRVLRSNPRDERDFGERSSTGLRCNGVLLVAPDDEARRALHLLIESARLAGGRGRPEIENRRAKHLASEECDVVLVAPRARRAGLQGTARCPPVIAVVTERAISRHFAIASRGRRRR